jgi:hypothetical protein
MSRKNSQKTINEDVQRAINAERSRKLQRDMDDFAEWLFQSGSDLYKLFIPKKYRRSEQQHGIQG